LSLIPKNAKCQPCINHHGWLMLSTVQTLYA
jgi:hypothetical protein